ncbi:hypothetical protein IFM89_019820 [Coptis chinensis]|uniref:Uncharacterized protein n=1 Tax=Coptis chinensis TaxID=261450 RepID=A0A835M357_9MAGN|nr:hypothetical protein IFM89_019820 [Coptis chinensis]
MGAVDWSGSVSFSLKGPVSHRLLSGAQTCQVRELHRIYKVQKLLMAEFRNNEPQLHSATILSSQTGRIGGKCIVTDNQTGFWTTATISETNHSPFSSWNHSLSNQTNSGYNFNTLISMRADPHLQEQSSSCSRDTSKMPRGFDLERLAEADISNDISVIEDKAEPNSLKSSKDKMNITSSCDPCFYNDGENKVELTLSIVFRTNKKNSKNCKAHSSLESGCSKPNNYERRELDRSLSIRLDAGDHYSERTNNTGSAGAAFDREGLQQPPWLFQALSLNRT